MPKLNQTAIDTTLDAEEALTTQELHTIKKRSIAGVISFFFRGIVITLIGIVASGVLSAYLSPADFGVFGLVTQIIALLTFFSDIGLAASLIQKKDEPTEAEYRTAFTVQQLLAWVIFAIALMLVASGVVQPKIGTAGAWVLLSLAFSFPLATFKTISHLKLERRLEFGKAVLPQVFEQLIFNVLLIVLAWRGMGVMAYTYAILARSVVGIVAIQYLMPWQPALAWEQSVLKNLLSFGAKFQINDFLARVKDSLFYLVLGIYLPLDQFGYIQWGKNWSQYPYTLTVQHITAVTFPTFARLQGSKPALARAIEKTLFFISLVIFPILVGMCVFIFPLVVLVPDYHKWQPALLSFVLFCLSIGWGAISTPLTTTLNAIGEINKTLKLMIMWTSLTWILTPVGIYLYGYNGVAIAAFVIAFTSVAPMYYVAQILPVKIWEQVWRQLTAASVMGLVGWIGLEWWQQSLQMMVVGMATVGSSYILTIAVVGKDKLWAEIKSLRKV